MTLLSAKNFSIAMAATLATATVVAHANPAHAFVISTSSSFPSSVNGYPVTTSDNFTDPSITLNGATIQGSGNLKMFAGDSPTFTFANPLAYFGIQLATKLPQGRTLTFLINDTNTVQFFGDIANNTILNIFSGNATERISTLKITKSGDGDTQFSAYATAVPTPALLPGLMGLGAAAWRKRKRGEESQPERETANV